MMFNFNSENVVLSRLIVMIFYCTEVGYNIELESNNWTAEGKRKKERERAPTK